MLTSTFRRRLLLKIFMFADLCVFSAALLLALWVTPYDSFIGRTSLLKILSMRVRLINFLAFLAMGGTWHFLFEAFNLYQSQRLNKWSRELIDILKATTLGAIILILFGCFFDKAFITPAFVVIFWAICTILTFALRKFVRSFLRAIRFYGVNLRFILIVGSNQRACELGSQFAARQELGYRIVGYVAEENHLAEQSINILGTLKDFSEIIKNNVIDEIIVTLPVKSSYEEIQRIVRLAEDQGIKVRCLKNIFETHAVEKRQTNPDELPEMTTISGHKETWHYLLKRVIDIVVSAILIILASPIMFCTAIAIKITSPGPVFFRQLRMGLNKRHFWLIKFRTMVVDAEALQQKYEHLNEMDGPVFKISNDPRVTKIGAWFRKTSIDELPQLFNVLNGDMSLVGPRPLPIRDYNGFDEDWQRKRFSVSPGITCIWQISGRNDVSFDDWMKMDMEYIENWSLLNDLKIFLKTIPAVINKKGAA